MKKIKILYAAGNRPEVYLQMQRILHHLDDQYFTVKIAAYNNYYFQQIDWTLDALKNVLDKRNFSIKSPYLSDYYEQVKLYNPDLIISDLEVYSSYIGNLLGIKVWQVSPLLFLFAEKNWSTFNDRYSTLVDDIFGSEYDYLTNVFNNSEQKFIYSYFADLKQQPVIVEGYDWIRPYHMMGKKHSVSQYQVCAQLFDNNKKIINQLKEYNKETVLYSFNNQEQYSFLKLKKIEYNEDYYYNIFNSNLIYNQGYSHFLADAFYNKQFSWVNPNYLSLDSAFYSIYSENFGLSKSIYHQIELMEEKKIDYNYNLNVKYLHQKIFDIL